MTRRAEGTALLQNEAYRNENARLIQMLSKTKEYANFGNFAQDSGMVRYMDPCNGEESKSSLVSTKTANTVCIGEDDGSDDWIPEEAYKAAHDFRNKCAANVSKALMNTLLQDLNKIWRARE